MISREEYNKALDIVEAYHKQLILCGVGSSLRDVSKTPLLEWDKIKLLDTRTQNGLICWYKYELDKRGKTLFVEDISKKEFKRIRHLGQKSWTDFVEKRGY
jgi:hypothetical protein